jgi:flavin reductase (DIM6/NTAB) family NADH-FMN oxidoreductase RutF
MKKIKLNKEQLQKAYMFLQPSRPVLVTTLNQDGSTHVAPFSWVMSLSYNPPLIGLSLLAKPKKQHSLENIIKHPEFTINVPGLDLAYSLVQCSYDFEDGIKRIDILNLTTSYAKIVKPLLIEKCRAHLECKVFTITPTGDHLLIIAEVVNVNYDPRAYTKSLLLKVSKNPPCFHVGHYRKTNGQTHLFLAPSEIITTEVPYPN